MCILVTYNSEGLQARIGLAGARLTETEADKLQQELTYIVKEKKKMHA